MTRERKVVLLLLVLDIKTDSESVGRTWFWLHLALSCFQSLLNLSEGLWTIVHFLLTCSFSSDNICEEILMTTVVFTLLKCTSWSRRTAWLEQQSNLDLIKRSSWMHGKALIRLKSGWWQCYAVPWWVLTETDCEKAVHSLYYILRSYLLAICKSSDKKLPLEPD